MKVQGSLLTQASWGGAGQGKGPERGQPGRDAWEEEEERWRDR